MRIIKAEVDNFGSYKHLEFSYENLGLTLVYGKTGSGKSTLADIVPWVLYGVTAKDGAADEVRNWTSYEPTRGTVILELANGQTLEVTRIRGKASQNDLFYNVDNNAVDDVLDRTHIRPFRGKDLQDTQKQLNALLGCDAATFAAGAYVSEFSATGAFFTAAASKRRSLLERIADTSLAARLADRSADARKEAKARASVDEQSVRDFTTKISSNEKSLLLVSKQSKVWTISHEARLDGLMVKSANFDKDKTAANVSLAAQIHIWESNKAKTIKAAQDKLYETNSLLDKVPDWDKKKKALLKEIETLDASRCNECGGPKAGVEVQRLRKQLLEAERASDKVGMAVNECLALKERLKRLAEETNPYLLLLEKSKTETNTYDEQLAELMEETDPYAPNIHIYQEEIKTAQTDLAIAEANYRRSQGDFGAYSALQDISVTFRGELVRQAVSEIQDHTNKLLENYFDAEIRVSFAMDGDSIDVSIFKSGHEATFTQLSKGQRGLLKLCFSVAVMEASSNRSGVHMSYLAFDESLDGLDSQLKTRAYDLLLSLSEKHETILVIDHDPGLHQMFPNKIQATLEADESVLTYE